MIRKLGQMGVEHDALLLGAKDGALLHDYQVEYFTAAFGACMEAVLHFLKKPPVCRRIFSSCSSPQRTTHPHGASFPICLFTHNLFKIRINRKMGVHFNRNRV